MNNENYAVCQVCKPKVVNIGLKSFYDALISQNVQAIQLDWSVPVEQSPEMVDLLDDLL